MEYRPVDIGARLRNLRLARNLTQEELAERADLTKGFISSLSAIRPAFRWTVSSGS
ncbi:MAG: helix-turn-helix transcriptional regulator [bacterium]|nr:helix-turn-helix transcriptional regulator [bacterium]